MNNYEFCANFARLNLPKNGKLLDYGCGNGQIAELAIKAGVDAYGCDLFYDGGDASSEVRQDLMGSAILRMEGDQIPFPDAHFDMVVNNQVIEHVPDLDVVLNEIARVLKPGGVMLSLFPDRGVWREVHCGIPFLHRFPKHTRLRVHYAHLMRRTGLGYFKGDKPPKLWAEEFCQWLDDWTHYRPMHEIRAAFERQFCDMKSMEADYFRARTGSRAVPSVLARFITLKWGGRVIEVRRKP